MKHVAATLNQLILGHDANSRSICLNLGLGHSGLEFDEVCCKPSLPGDQNAAQSAQAAWHGQLGGALLCMLDIGEAARASQPIAEVSRMIRLAASDVSPMVQQAKHDNSEFCY